jgi:hypothetical protein
MFGTQKPLADTDRGNMLEEPGAEDNRLTIDPSDPRWAKTIADWKDGASYTLSSVKVQQMAPGDFRIVGFQVSQEPESPEEAAEADGGAANDQSNSSAGYPNPAVQRLMDDDYQKR